MLIKKAALHAAGSLKGRHCRVRRYRALLERIGGIAANGAHIFSPSDDEHFVIAQPVHRCRLRKIALSFAKKKKELKVGSAWLFLVSPGLLLAPLGSSWPLLQAKK